MKPNKLKCKCGYCWKVSQRIVRRPLDCPKCGRYYWYIRELDGSYKKHYIGRYLSDKEREKELLKHGKDNR